MGTCQPSLLPAAASLGEKTIPLTITMHLLLAFMVGSCMAMSVRKSPYTYQSNPMARMSMQARHHSGGSSWNTRSKNPFSYMVGKEFFKNENFDGDFFEDSHEELPYSVTQNYGNYEKRHYPEAVMACTYDLVDQAGDPLAGLENYNPYTIMSSRRFQKTPASIMFRRLFKYISGVNQERKEIEMTRPVSTLHKEVKEDSLGNLEMLLMCFYLPSEYQPNHSHPHKETKPAPVARHASHSAPTPMEDSRVEILTRPEIDVYVRTFDGFALTADTWERQRQILLDDLIGKRVKDDEWFCNMYNTPMEMTNRRNEVWVQADDGEVADVSTVVHELLHEELPHHENHPHPHQ